MPTGPPTGIALLGAGIFAKEAHLPAIAAAGERCVLLAVYSRSFKSASSIASDTQELLKLSDPPSIYCDDAASNSGAAGDLKALLARSDITATLIALPITAQPDIVRTCLSADKHVLSEKPVAPDVASGRSLVNEYEKDYKSKGIIWRVAENWEVEAGYRAAAKVIRDGVIGDVRFFRLTNIGMVDTGGKWYRTGWRTIPDYQGGFLLDGGVHSAALLRVLLPSPIATVSSFASLAQKHLPPADTLTAIVSCAPLSGPVASADPPPTLTAGAHGIFELSFGAPAPSRSEGGGGTVTVVTGSNGWLELANAAFETSRLTVHRVTRAADPDPSTPGTIEEESEESEYKSDGVEVEVAAFLDALTGNDAGFGDPRETLRDVALLQAALTSGGVPVDMEKLLREG